MIRISEEAAAEVARRLEGQPETVGLRIYVRGYGWGGPSLGLALDEPQNDDVTVVQNGARVYVESRVGKWFEGAELGWSTDAWGSGFTFNHPAMGSC